MLRRDFYSEPRSKETATYNAKEHCTHCMVIWFWKQSFSLIARKQLILKIKILVIIRNSNLWQCMYYFSKCSVSILCHFSVQKLKWTIGSGESDIITAHSGNQLDCFYDLQTFPSLPCYLLGGSSLGFSFSF